jgi:8-oxo-dGTP diphosphatase
VPAEPLPLHVATIGLTRGSSGVLMVESKYPDAEPFWALPGGLVEAGESFPEALVREVREETGLQVEGSCPILATMHILTRPGSPDLVVFVCEIRSWSGELAPNDPDGVTLQAAFVPTDIAIDRLEALPWRNGEPIIRLLRGSPPGGVWVYSRDGAQPWEGISHLVHAPENP